MPRQSGIQNAVYQRGFPAARHPGYHREHFQGETHVDALQVVLARALDFDITAHRTAGGGHFDLFLIAQVTRRERIALCQLGRRSAKDDLPAVDPRSGTDVHQQVAGLHHFPVVFHHDDRIADVPQFLQHGDKPVGIPLVQTDGGLVQDVHRTHQGTSQGRGQVDALGFPARKGRGGAIERQIPQPHLAQETDPPADLRQNARGDLLLILRQGKGIEEFAQPIQRPVHQFGEAAAAHPDIAGLRPQPLAVAHRAYGLSPIACQHDAVVHLVAVPLEHGKEVVDAFEVFRAVPQLVFLLGREFAIRRVDGKSGALGGIDHRLLPQPHFFAPPRGYGLLIDRKRGVGHHQCRVDAHHLSVSFAFGAGAQRVVERKQVFGRFDKIDAVGAKRIGKRPDRSRAGFRYLHRSMAFIKSGGYRVGQTGQGSFVCRGFGAVHHQEETVEVLLYRESHQVGQFDHLSLQFDPGIPLGVEGGHGLGKGPPGGDAIFRFDLDGGADGQGADVVDHVAHLLALHQLSAHRRIRLPDAGVKQFEVVVHFARGAHGRTRIGGIDLLADGDGGCDAFDVLYLRFVDAPQELTGVGREALHVPALSFGVQGVVGQGGLSAARKSGEHDELAVRKCQVDVLEVVHIGPFDEDVFAGVEFVQIQSHSLFLFLNPQRY